jgi:hypothetical protein
MKLQVGLDNTSTVIEGSYFTALTIDINSVPRPNFPLGPAQAASALDELEIELRQVISDGYDYLTASRH